MMTAFTALLGVMLLLDPTELIDREAAAAISDDANRVEIATGPAVQAERRKSAHIHSKTSDFDRKEGVIYFEGDVRIDYETDYTMCADRIFVFLTASNRLARVVAVGNVSITNETRVGTCAMATYRKKKGEIEMFGEKGGELAHLAEQGEDASELEGERIRFWLDSEQVQVENSRIGVESSGKDCYER